MLETIMDKLQDKVTDVFIEMQNELTIDCGDCEPLDEYELEKAEEALAEIIARIIRKQGNE